MTMVMNDNAGGMYSARLAIRVYARLADGSYVYGDIYSFSYFDLCKHLYDNRLSSNYGAHLYLYEKVLRAVDPAYREVNYNWNNIFARP